MSKVDWKQKYENLRSKYMNAIDVAFRLGYQEGSRAAEMEAIQAELQGLKQAQEMQGLNGGMGGDPGMGDGMEATSGEEIAEEAMEQQPEEGGSELESSMNELEEYVKSEEDIKNLMKNMHNNDAGDKSDKNKSDKEKKLDGLIKKWEDEKDTSTVSTENNEIIGQA